MVYRTPTVYIQTHLRNVLISLKKLKHGNKREEIHRLRVGIKKIRAMLRFMKESSQVKISTTQLDILFEDAGLIREYSVNIRLLEKYKMQNAIVISILRKDLLRSEKNFKSRIHLYIADLDKFEKQKSITKLEWPNVKKLKKHFEKKNSHLNIKKIKSRKKLHQFRMKLKRLLYVYDALSVTKKKLVKFKGKEIDQLQNEIGKWHDLFTAKQLIRKLNLDKKKVFVSIIKKEKKEFKTLLPQLKNIWK